MIFLTLAPEKTCRLFYRLYIPNGVQRQSNATKAKKAQEVTMGTD